MKLTPEEKETIICYNEGQQTASVYTHNMALRHRLEKLAAEHPDDCKLEKTSHSGQAVDYIVPKAWVKIKPLPRLTAEQREAMAERGRNLASKRQNER